MAMKVHVLTVVFVVFVASHARGVTPMLTI